MLWVAWKMLIGNRVKYLGIVFGVVFAALLIAQQSSIFCGLMALTISQIRDVEGPEIWVMDRNVQFVDDVKPLADTELFRVKGVPGVEWAVSFYKGIARARLQEGTYEQMVLLGLDDATLVGAPGGVFMGSIADLRRPDAVIMDDAGYKRIWPNEPFRLGRVFEMNDRRAVLVGITKASRTFQSFPIVYTRYSQAIQYAPPERKVLSFVLADAAPGVPPEEVCRRIAAQTGLQALTRKQFIWKTIRHYLAKTGIPVNFGITVFLGFLVGTAIAGQTFYLFTVENIRQFGALKAMGTSNWTILTMVLSQALQVGVVGYGIGVGLAALFGRVVTGGLSRLSFFMPWEVLAITAVAVFVIVLLASLLSIRKVLVVDPAIVFRG
ncbi:MAG: FtsX-like permease family protein [Planctomycetia bacterium]|nr:FtsX-like permease family protein [Planctomycetia bacterium]